LEVWRPALALALLATSCSRHAGAMSEAAYDEWRRPDALVAALAVPVGGRVADVGAGDGYLTFRLARAAGPTGRVLATDVDADALSRLAAAAPSPSSGAAPIRVRPVPRDDPSLEPRSYDLVLLAEVDHLLVDRVAYFRKLAAALATGGRIAVSNRAYRRPELERDAARAGLRLSTVAVELPDQFLVMLTPERNP
jgi:SAM-dependent methyltransferase